MVKTVNRKVEEKIQKTFTQFYGSGYICPFPKGFKKGIFSVLKNIRNTRQIRQGFIETPKAYQVQPRMENL